MVERLMKKQEVRRKERVCYSQPTTDSGSQGNESKYQQMSFLELFKEVCFMQYQIIPPPDARIRVVKIKIATDVFYRLKPKIKVPKMMLGREGKIDIPYLDCHAQSTSHERKINFDVCHYYLVLFCIFLSPVFINALSIHYSYKNILQTLFFTISLLLTKLQYMANI